MAKEKRWEPNGDYFMPYYIIECDGCHNVFPDSYGYYDHNGCQYCLDCAYRRKMITDQDYLDEMAFPAKKVGINPTTQEIECAINKFSWEKTDKDYRSTKEYGDWRTSVFERDDYTCKSCGQIGGKLEAHHIKTFNQYPELRFELSNGITLCKQCHKKHHKEDRNGRKKNVHQKNNPK